MKCKDCNAPLDSLGICQQCAEASEWEDSMSIRKRDLFVGVLAILAIGYFVL